ncbi:MAG: WG repeat-containing protein [Ruminococcaceae bacterium]|nr:WG repeat-containing protein [Oscillospiraceae bacterium]
MKAWKKIAARIIPVGIMAFLVVAVIAYQRGVYDITFIERPSTDTTAAEAPIPPDDTAPPAVDTTAPETNGADTEQPPENPTVIEDEAGKIEAFFATLDPTSTMVSRGYRITDAIFDEGVYLTLLNTTSTLRDDFSLRKKVVAVPERIPDELDSGYTTVYNNVSVDRPHVEIYMDYIFIDNGRTVDILRADGTVLQRSFDIGMYKPAYTRDNSDAALFKTEEPSQSRYGVTITKYFRFDETGKLIESDYNDESDNRGLYANYPTYFGKSDNNFQRFYKNGYFAYGQNNIPTTNYRYKTAYNFSEGYAAVVDDEGVLKFVQKWFYPQISGTKVYINSSKRRVYANYMAPDTNGPESLGFYYFDHGLVRMRNQEYDAYHIEELNSKDITVDEEFLMKLDGTRYQLPKDYNLVSYSNGMILLEKNGYYGFMDYTGKWIAQPIYTEAEPFNEGLAVVGIDGVYGMIDTEGDFVIPMLFDHISGASGGIVAAYDGSTGWQLFNKVQK